MEVDKKTCQSDVVVRNADVVVRNAQILLDQLLQKYKDETLEEEDFHINLLETLFSSEENIDKSTDLDEIIPVEFELELENGEIKVTSPSRKSFGYYNEGYSGNRGDKLEKTNKRIIQHEEMLRNKMKQLMDTFEDETRKLDQKLKMETEVIRKKYDTEYTVKLQDEKAYFQGVINGLLKRLEQIKEDREELVLNYEEEKRDIERFYVQKITDDRKKFKLDLQTKLLQAHKQWQNTKI